MSGLALGERDRSLGSVNGFTRGVCKVRMCDAVPQVRWRLVAQEHPHVCSATEVLPKDDRGTDRLVEALDIKGVRELP